MHARSWQHYFMKLVITLRSPTSYVKKMNVSSVIRPLRTSGIHGISAQVSTGIKRLAAERVNCTTQLTAQSCSSSTLHSQSWQCTPHRTPPCPRVFCKASWTLQAKQDALCLTSEPRFLRFSFVSCIRQLSSNSSNIGKDCEVADSEEEVEWNHPASRTQDALSQDPELRSILCEIASDFGKSHITPTDSETTGTHEHEASKVESNNEGSIARDLKEGFVAMTTEYEDEAESMDVVEVSLAKASRNASDSSFVFSIDDIVEILREENAQDICVIAVPPEKNYVDYFIVVTGRSTRHLSAMTQFVNKLYKQRKGKDDPFLIVEGKFAEDWMCLDFGNIVVHFMLEETRAVYNLEELWTMGKELDSHIQQWDQHEVLLFNPETDLHTASQEQEETPEK